MLAAAALLLLLAPPPPQKTHELRYKFAKDWRYVESQVREWQLASTVEDRELEWHARTTLKLRRTILGVDETAHPTIERVEVLAFRTDMLATPEAGKEGARAEPSQGKTFVWRRLEKRWGLFDEKGEVTAMHPKLVDHLKNWGDVRLPGKAVAVGDSWEVDPRRFMENVGQLVPPDVQGLCAFRLAAVDDDGIATIEFDVKNRYKDGEDVVSGAQTGTWRFDVKRGRDVKLEMTAKILLNEGHSGRGSLKMTRTVTSAPVRESKPRGG